MECRKQKKREWYVRLSEELKQHKEALFLTLTFNEDMYEETRKAVNAGTDPTNEEENDMCRYAIRPRCFVAIFEEGHLRRRK